MEPLTAVEAARVLHDTRAAMGFVLVMVAVAIAIVGCLAGRWMDEFERRRAVRAEAKAPRPRPAMSTDPVFISAPIGRATVQAPWIVLDAPRDRHGNEIVQ